MWPNLELIATEQRRACKRSGGGGKYDARVGPRLAIEQTGQGEPLVLLHGIATDRRIWDLVTPRLAAQRRVISVDLPGFGGSLPVGDEFDLEQVAVRIARGLAAQGIRGPFDLAGHSLGGGVALTLAASRPRAVRRLVLVAPAGLKPLPPRIAGILAAAANGVIAARRGAAPLTDLAWGRRLLLTGVVADGAELPPSLARRMVQASSTAVRTAPALRTIATADLRPLLTESRVPLGVIWGEADQTMPVGTVAEVAEARPDAIVARLRDTGHVPMVERPAAFVDALEWLLHELPSVLRDETTSSGAPPMLF
jgi:pimeloyl-ACP methyl ester carboxylesterase